MNITVIKFPKICEISTGIVRAFQILTHLILFNN